MHRLLVLDVVGLTSAHLGPYTPALCALAEGGSRAPIRTILPAVTCSVQATFLTGTLPRDHGCVANGWYFRDLSEVWLWRQSNRLVGGPKIWDEARRRDARFTCAKLFWWYNMYAAADVSVTPRPVYRANGRKLPDVYAHPAGLRERLTADLGTFPLFNFWGPAADLRSSEWIARCAERVEQWYQPTLSLVYLPHLDYDLQRKGPDDPVVGEALRAIDAICGRLIDQARRDGVRVVVLSEYGIVPVRGPVHINRILRNAGLVAFREECGEEHLDPGGSDAFAVSDHQIAHVYVRDPERTHEVKALLEGAPGIELVLGEDGKRAHGLDHPRSGELVAVSAPDRWFSYYWWNDDARAPDYARTVDIHAKPGYDPVELFVDPSIRFPKLAIGAKLFRRNVLGQRTLLDVIPLDAGLVRGSHGRPTDDLEDGPVFISSEAFVEDRSHVEALDVQALLLAHLFDGSRR